MSLLINNMLLKILRYRNLRSGNSARACSRILAFPLDVGLGVGGPFFVDLDEHGADEALERGVVRKDPDLDGAPLEFLLEFKRQAIDPVDQS